MILPHDWEVVQRCKETGEPTWLLAEVGSYNATIEFIQTPCPSGNAINEWYAYDSRGREKAWPFESTELEAVKSEVDSWL